MDFHNTFLITIMISSLKTILDISLFSQSSIFQYHSSFQTLLYARSVYISTTYHSFTPVTVHIYP